MVKIPGSQVYAFLQNGTALFSVRCCRIKSGNQAALQNRHKNRIAAHKQTVVSVLVSVMEHTCDDPFLTRCQHDRIFNMKIGTPSVVFQLKQGGVNLGL